MNIKIIEIYEQNNVLRIETECDYGKDNLGLSLDKKYLDPVTQKPKYLKEIKSLLENKYNQALATKKEIKDDYSGKEIDLSKI